MVDLETGASRLRFIASGQWITGIHFDVNTNLIFAAGSEGKTRVCIALFHPGSLIRLLISMSSSMTYGREEVLQLSTTPAEPVVLRWIVSLLIHRAICW